MPPPTQNAVKSFSDVYVQDDHEISRITFEKGGTEQDGVDMHRMGKLQQLRVSNLNEFTESA